MRSALAIPAVAAIVLAGSVFSGPASAQANLAFCLHNAAGAGTVQCNYRTMAACEKFARPGTAFCTPNPRHQAATQRETTGAAGPGFFGPHRPYMVGNAGVCLHDANVGRMNCTYATMEQCTFFARPGNSFCRPNRYTERTPR